MGITAGKILERPSCPSLVSRSGEPITSWEASALCSPWGSNSGSLSRCAGDALGWPTRPRGFESDGCKES